MVDTADRYRSTQPFVRVGNILGDRVNSRVETADFQYFDQDTIERKFTITDGDDDGGIVYEGESNKVFKVEFVANGPMYTIKPPDDGAVQQASITVTIPDVPSPRSLSRAMIRRRISMSRQLIFQPMLRITSVLPQAAG